MKLAVAAVVAFGASAARADDVHDLVDAIGHRDTAEVLRHVGDTVRTHDLWFDDARCMHRFANAEVARKDVPALVACLAALRIHEDGAVFAYDPGVRLEFTVDGSGDGAKWTDVVAPRLTHTSVRLPEIESDTLEAHRASGTADVVPDAATREALKPGYELQVDLAFCVDENGRVTTAQIESSNPGPYGDTVLAAARKWTFKPIVARGKAVKVCTSEILTYLGPPQPPIATPMPQNVAPTDLEAHRAFGSKDVVPSAATKAQIQKMTIGSFKLCVSEKGRVTAVNVLKSSGLPDLDRELDAAIRAWTYRPYLVNGQATPVCTAITFIYKP